MLTKNGVCYNLPESHFRTTQNGVTFVFSSQLYLDKFLQRLQENRDIINFSLTKRFGFTVNVSTLADVVLYKRIEKRGFLIVMGDKEITCQKSLICGGSNVMKKESIN